MRKLDIIGEKYGRLLVLEELDKRYGKKKERVFLCRCDCGNTTEKPIQSLRSGRAKSCGCFQKESRTHEYRGGHGKSSHELAHTWYGMINRCYNEKSESYHQYGALGVKVCNRWKENMANFIEDIERELGDRPKGYSLDRIDPYGDYTIENVRWADITTQNLNKRKGSNTGQDYIFKKDKGYRVSIEREGHRRESLLFHDIDNAIELRDDWLKEFDENSKEWIDKTDSKEYNRTTIKEVLNIDKNKHIIKNKAGYYYVEITNEKTRRRKNVSSFEEALILRNKWLEEYFNNPKKWIQDTINNEYKKSV